jgi:undecaprenyl-diphosphatase
MDEMSSISEANSTRHIGRHSDKLCRSVSDLLDLSLIAELRAFLRYLCEGLLSMILIGQYLMKWDCMVLTRISGSVKKGCIIQPMQWISRVADGQAYPLVLGFVAILQPEPWKFLSTCCFSFAVELVAYKVIKEAVRRPRPFQKVKGIVNLVAPQDVFSFPSGHTAGAFVAATLIIGCYPVILVPAFLWALLVGFSRVYLGVHYPTDVLSGACLGLMGAWAGPRLAGYVFSLQNF